MRASYRTRFPSYRAAHDRVQAQRGKAAEHTCVDCGGSASEWSYDHQDKDELRGLAGTREVAYSGDPAHYEARCHPCHVKFDMPVRTPIDGPEIGEKCGTYAGVNAHRRNGSQPCRRCREVAVAYLREWRRRKREETA